jgi:hypothetical protein
MLQDLHLQNVPGGFLILLKAGSFQLANSLIFNGMSNS